MWQDAPLDLKVTCKAEESIHPSRTFEYWWSFGVVTGSVWVFLCVCVVRLYLITHHSSQPTSPYCCDLVPLSSPAFRLLPTWNSRVVWTELSLYCHRQPLTFWPRVSEVCRNYGWTLEFSTPPSCKLSSVKKPNCSLHRQKHTKTKDMDRYYMDMTSLHLCIIWLSITLNHISAYSDMHFHKAMMRYTEGECKGIT